MDYLDPRKQRQHTIILFTGYLLITAAIVIGTIVLVYLAYGFGVGKNGAIIQNGFVFFSSQPNPASITLNGKPQKTKTNSRLSLPEGIYQTTITRSGYRSWQRTIEVDGGAVEHFDYPFLFPQTLTSAKLPTYTAGAAPQVASQSADQRWLVVLPSGSTAFELYDLKNPTKAATSLSLPASIVSSATSTQHWQAIAWADDNQHVLLQHSYDNKTEYILLDRTDPAASLNVTQTLNLNATTTVSFKNRKFDQYYLYDTAAKTVASVTLKDTTAVALLTHVLAFQSYGDDTLLYVSDDNVASGKVALRQQTIGAPAVTLRAFPNGTTYLVDLTKYSGTMYVAAGAVSEGKVYIYKDPAAQVANKQQPIAVPAQVLRAPNPSWLEFSPNTQFIAIEGGESFGVYDIKNTHGYNYTAKQPLDSPQPHANWMDGDRMDYVSNGDVTVFDYDHANQQTLMPASASFTPFFSANYHFVYTLSPTSDGQVVLDQTSLLTKADQ